MQRRPVRASPMVMRTFSGHDHPCVVPAKALSPPEPNIVRRLYECYYLSDPPVQQAPLLSSHWEYFSRQFAVEIDETGRPCALRGAGFGALEARRTPIEWLLSVVVMASQLALTPNRGDIVRLVRPALRVCRAARLHFSFQAFRQVADLSVIVRHLSTIIRTTRPLIIINIGDGYGFLSALIKRVLPEARLVLVDLGKTLLFQAVTCQAVHPTSTHHVVLPAQLSNQPDWMASEFIYCPAEYLEELDQFVFDIGINIASMQEMNTATIERYFSFLRRHLRPDSNLFYCVNREVKDLRGGERTVFDAYPWSPRDRHLVDGYVPWRNRFAILPASVRSRKLGAYLPLVNSPRKPMRMRLTVLATEP